MQDNSLYYGLITHPFIIASMKNMDSVLKSLDKEFKESLQEETKTEPQVEQSKKSKGRQSSSSLTLTKEQAYHNQIFGHTSNLTHAVERLEEIPFFLARFPNTKTFQKQGITLHKWIQYHYSNFLITGVSVYDTALLLINSVFMLGLRPQDCNDRTVTKNQNVRYYTPVGDAVKKLNNVTKHYREPRNLYVHRNRLPAFELLDMLEEHRFIQEGYENLEIATKSADGPTVDNPIFRDMLYKHERRELIKRVRSETATIADSIREIFDALNPIYLAYSSSFRGEAR